MEERKEEKKEQQESLFRPEAVEHKASTSQFEQNLYLIRYRRWLTRTAVLAIILSALYWFIFGTIPIEAKGVGIAVNVEGISNVESSFNGIVKNLHHHVGDHVQQGDLLVILNNPEIEARLEKIKTTIASLENRLSILRIQVSDEAIAEKQALSKSIKASELKIQLLQKDIPILQEDVKIKEELAVKGLFNSQSLQRNKELLWSKQTELEKTKAKLSTYHFDLKKGYRDEEVEALFEQLLTHLEEKQLLETQLHYKNIYSPVSGTLLEWFTTPNTYVAAGDLIARLEIQGEEESNKIFYGYLPLEEGRKIRLQAEVEIELSNIKSQEYGALIGNIISVSPYAVSPESLTRLINNPALIEYFLNKHEAVIEVVIKPQKNSKTISGYRWTSGEGPPLQITSGTLCTFKGLVQEIRPIYYVIPVWWFKKFFYSSYNLYKLNAKIAN